MNDYGIGLDIGTSSVGWSVTDANGKVLRVRKDLGIGARLFQEGQPAAERRTFRTTRRRLNRRKWRLGLLKEIFAPYIAEADPNFFERLKYFGISPKDTNGPKTAKTLFNDRTDKDFYSEYPTIYHLREALMTEKRQFDIREIYLAIHHIVKYRGHFLLNGSADDFHPGVLDLHTGFQIINENAASIFQFNAPLLTSDKSVLLKAQAIMTDQQLSPTSRQKDLVALLFVKSESTEDDKARKKVLTEVLKGILDLKTALNTIGNAEVSPDELADWKIKFESYADFLDAHADELTDEQLDLFDAIQTLYSQVMLASIVPSGGSLSSGMIAKYDQHRSDLALLKAYRNALPPNQSRSVKAIYRNYIQTDDKSKKLTYDDFIREISKLVKESSDEPKEAAQIRTRIDQGDFMPKLRSGANGVIPHQLQQRELDQIIDNQKTYYPWLAEANPVKERQSTLPYKLDELVAFRIPYYVGPLITADQQKKTSDADYAWMVRKGDPNDTSRITPWNFAEKVDKERSATQFINRMKTTDTYLIGEDVLPKKSLLYQRFEVLNELNNLRVNNQRLGVPTKQRLFEQLFMHYRNVTVKMIQDNLVSNSEYSQKPTVTGLADPKKVTAQLSTYHDLKKIIPDQIDDSEYRTDVENIVAWATLFEDSDIFRDKLDTINWLNDGQRQRLSKIRYRGWGQFSATLLHGIRDSKGKTVIDRLWESSDNFMQIVSSTNSEFAKKITDHNAGFLSNQDLNEVIDNAYTSPSNKKAIREVLRVVADIQKAMHGRAPKWIFVEAARGEDKNKRPTVNRARKLLDVYENDAKEIVSTQTRQELLDHQKDADFTDKLVLYFMQNGRDIYTDKKINLNSLSFYQIDHILPQALIKDDSLDNRVLTATSVNNLKSDQFASERFGAKMRGTWTRLAKAGLITQRKLRNLEMRPDEIDKYALGFIKRQLVETRQIIKLVTDILAQQYGKDTEIVSIRANLSHQFRVQFDYPKVRSLNNYHHAFDAFLAARLGLYLYKRYPKLRSLFTYGNYTPFETHLKEFDFIRPLTKPEPIIDKETGEILWQKDADLAYFTHIYGLKKIFVTREVTTNFGAMFNQTIFKHTTAGSKKLVPIKQGRDVALYGGYTHKIAAYMAIVRIHDKRKGDYLRVLPVYNLVVGTIQKASKQGPNATMAALKKMLSPLLANSKGIVPEFDVAAPKVYFDQKVISDSAAFLLGTNIYIHNSQELWLSREDQQKLINKDADDQDLEDVFTHIREQVKKYFPMYDINQFRKKLDDAAERFGKLPLTDDNPKADTKRSVLEAVMNGLHANAAITDLKVLGIKTPFGQMNVPSGIVLSNNAQLVEESPTGLFVNKRKL